jgi:hypothetical protein
MTQRLGPLPAAAERRLPAGRHQQRAGPTPGDRPTALRLLAAWSGSIRETDSTRPRWQAASNVIDSPGRPLRFPLPMRQR